MTTATLHADHKRMARELSRLKDRNMDLAERLHVTQMECDRLRRVVAMARREARK